VQIYGFVDTNPDPIAEEIAEADDRDAGGPGGDP